MGGYAVNESGVTARGGSPASARAQPDVDTTPGAFPPHPKRSRSVRGGKAKRVSPPSAESFGGPLMLPLSELRYQQVRCNCAFDVRGIRTGAPFARILRLQQSTQQAPLLANHVTMHMQCAISLMPAFSMPRAIPYCRTSPVWYQDPAGVLAHKVRSTSVHFLENRRC